MGRGSPRSPRRHACVRCAAVFASVDALQRHVVDARHFRCAHRGCHRDFDTRDELAEHRTTCRPTPLRRQSVALSPAALVTIQEVAARRQRVEGLASQPRAYRSDGRQRFVFMDTDNIIFSMLNSTHLHSLVRGAEASNSLRLRFDQFTKRVCGDEPAAVKMLRASYFGTADVLAQSLSRLGWDVTKREAASSCVDLHSEIERHEGGTSGRPSTLVLVTGDGGSDAKSSGSYRAVVDKLLRAKHWAVEVHAWAHSLHDGFIRLMEEHPTRVAVRLLDETDDLSDMVFSGKYTPGGATTTATKAPTVDGDETVRLRLQLREKAARIDTLKAENEQLRSTVQRLQEQLNKQGEKEDRAAKWQSFSDRVAALTCRVSRTLLTDPVLLSCCHQTVNRSVFERLVRDQGAGCPFCVAKQPAAVPNRLVDDVVRVFCQQLPS